MALLDAHNFKNSNNKGDSYRVIPDRLAISIRPVLPAGNVFPSVLV